jgi:hypothetical protein
VVVPEVMKVSEVAVSEVMKVSEVVVSEVMKMIHRVGGQRRWCGKHRARSLFAHPRRGAARTCIVCEHCAWRET